MTVLDPRPQNVAAEQHLLGALLVQNNVLDSIDLRADEFYDPLHAKIYEVISATISRGKIASPTSIRSYLEGQPPVTDDMTVPQYLGWLAARATTIINAPAYAQVVRSLATQRLLWQHCYDTIALIEQGDIEGTANILEEHEHAVAALGEQRSEDKIVDISVATKKAIADANEAGQRGDGLNGLPTGLPDLDRRIRGLRPGKVYIIAGRPGMGKSALGCQIAFHNAENGIPVALFSQEMGGDDISARFLAARGGINLENFTTGNLNQDEWRRITGAASAIDVLPITFDETSTHSLASLRRAARRLHRQQLAGLIVVDYLQLMEGRSGRNRVEDITEITKGLKILAKDLAIPVIVLSQLSRENEKRADKRPQLSDLRESGSIEQDADVVIFVHREDYYLKLAEPTANTEEYWAWKPKHEAVAGKAQLIIAKNRQGRTATAAVLFDGPTTSFRTDPNANEGQRMP